MNKNKLGYQLRIEARRQKLNAYTFSTLKNATEDESEREYDSYDE